MATRTQLQENTLRARSLRHESTNAEIKMWHLLRNRRFGGFKFHRQFSVGPFIADFCCFEKRLIVELDGSQHAEREVYDRRRTEYLEKLGYRVMRFWNEAVFKETNAVCNSILNELNGEGKNGN